MPVRQPTVIDQDQCVICQEKLVAGQEVLPCAYGCATYVCYSCLDNYPNGQTPYNQKCPTCNRNDWVGDPVTVV